MPVRVERQTPKRLDSGEYILVQNDRGPLRIATTTRGSKVARLTEPPEKTAHPSDPSKRGGYRLTTTLGVIPFVSGVAGIIIANNADIKRYEREVLDGQRAESESAASLNGLSMSDAERAAIATPLRSAPAVRSAGLAATLPPRPTPAQVTAAGRARVPAPTGRNAANNFWAMARVSKTERAREFWTARARSADERVTASV